jgi:hypothetical protein
VDCTYRRLVVAVRVTVGYDGGVPGACGECTIGGPYAGCAAARRVPRWAPFVTPVGRSVACSRQQAAIGRLPAGRTSTPSGRARTASWKPSGRPGWRCGRRRSTERNAATRPPPELAAGHNATLPEIADILAVCCSAEAAELLDYNGVQVMGFRVCPRHEERTTKEPFASKVGWWARDLADIGWDKLRVDVALEKLTTGQATPAGQADVGAGIATIGPSTSARTMVRPAIISRSGSSQNGGTNWAPPSKPSRWKQSTRASTASVCYLTLVQPCPLRPFT